MEGPAGAGERVYSLIQPMQAVAQWVAGSAEQIDDGHFPALDSTIETQLAAMEHLIHESESLGVNAELPRLIKAFANQAVANGHGGSGYAALIEQFRKPPRT